MQNQFAIVYFVSYKTPGNSEINRLLKGYHPETRNKVESTSSLLTTTMWQQQVVQTALQPFPWPPPSVQNTAS